MINISWHFHFPYPRAKLVFWRLNFLQNPQFTQEYNATGFGVAPPSNAKCSLEDPGSSREPTSSLKPALNPDTLSSLSPTGSALFVNDNVFSST